MSALHGLRPCLSCVTSSRWIEYSVVASPRTWSCVYASECATVFEMGSLSVHTIKIKINRNVNNHTVIQFFVREFRINHLIKFVPTLDWAHFFCRFFFFWKRKNRFSTYKSDLIHCFWSIFEMYWKHKPINQLNNVLRGIFVSATVSSRPKWTMQLQRHNHKMPYRCLFLFLVYQKPSTVNSKAGKEWTVFDRCLEHAYVYVCDVV